MKNGKENKAPGSGEWRDFMTGLKLLNESGARYVVVGGVASNLHGLSQSTKDIDILIPKDLENTEKILKALEGLLWGLSREILPKDVMAKPFTIIGDQPRVDLLLVAGKLKFNEAYLNREIKKVKGVVIPVASISDLIKSKQTDRPKDEQAIRDLKELQGLKEKIEK